MKKIVIGISGSIAAYKACELISRLKKKNYNIEVIMTKNAAQFVTPLTFGALIHKPVLIDDFDETGYQIKHISYAKKADCFIIILLRMLIVLSLFLQLQISLLKLLMV